MKFPQQIGTNASCIIPISFKSGMCPLQVKVSYEKLSQGSLIHLFTHVLSNTK